MEFMLLVCCFTIYFAPFPSIIRPPMGFEFDKLACRQFSLFFCSSVITFGLWIYAFSQRGSGAGQSLVTQLIIVLHLTQDAVPESGASFRSQKLQNQNRFRVASDEAHCLLSEKCYRIMHCQPVCSTPWCPTKGRKTVAFCKIQNEWKWKISFRPRWCHRLAISNWINSI